MQQSLETIHGDGNTCIHYQCRTEVGLQKKGKKASLNGGSNSQTWVAGKTTGIEQRQARQHKVTKDGWKSR